MDSTLHEKYLFSIKPDFATEECTGDQRPLPFLLLDIEQLFPYDHTSFLKNATALEWKLTIWRDSACQLTAEVRFPIAQEKPSNAQRQSRRLFALPLTYTFCGGNGLFHDSEVVFVVIELVFKFTGVVLHTLSRELRLYLSSIHKIPNTSGAHEIKLGINQTFKFPLTLPAQFRLTSLSIRLSLGMLSPAAPISAMHCQDRHSRFMLPMTLLRHPLPSPVAELLALVNHKSLSTRTHSHCSSRPSSNIAVDTSQAFQTMSVLRPEQFDYTCVSIQDVQLAQELHEWYRDNDLAVSARFLPSTDVEPMCDTFSVPVTCLGRLSSSAGEYLSNVYVSSRSEPNIPEYVDTKKNGNASHFENLVGINGLGYFSRFLLLFVTSSHDPDNNASAPGWEVCSGVLDLYAMMLKCNSAEVDELLEKNILSHSDFDYVTVEGVADIILTAAPLKTRESTVSCCMHDQCLKGNCITEPVCNLSTGSVAVGKMSLKLKLARLIHNGFAEVGPSLLKEAHRPALLLPEPSRSIYSSFFPPIGAVVWDGIYLSNKMQIAIDALVADPTIIASFFCFDQRDEETSLGVASGEWDICHSHHSFSEPSIHFDEFSLSEKVLLLSLMAEILNNYPNMTNFLKRLSLPANDNCDRQDRAGKGDELFPFFLPVIHQVLAKDLAKIYLTGGHDCCQPPGLVPCELLQLLLRKLRCEPVLVAYVGCWLRSNEFAETIANPFFSSKQALIPAQEPSPPSHYDYTFELERPKSSWVTLLSVCWCVSTIHADINHTLPFNEELNVETLVSTEVVSTHLLVSILYYGAAVIKDIIDKKSVCQSRVLPATTVFIENLYTAINILLGQVLSSHYNRYTGSEQVSCDESWCQRSTQLFTALNSFTENVASLFEEFPAVVSTFICFNVETVMEKLFSMSRLDLLSEHFDLENMCLRSCIRCSSTLISTFPSAFLQYESRMHESWRYCVLNKLAFYVCSKLSRSLEYLPSSVSKRKLELVPPRSRGKNKRLVCLSVGINSRNIEGFKLDIDKNLESSYSPFGDRKGWVCFGKISAFQFTESDFTECKAKLNVLVEDDCEEIDTLGILLALLNFMGDRCSVIRDVIMLVDGQEKALHFCDTTETEAVTNDGSSPQRSDDKFCNKSVFSRFRSKRISSDKVGSRSEICDCKENSKTEMWSDNVLVAMGPLHNMICVLWKALLGGEDIVWTNTAKSDEDTDGMESTTSVISYRAVAYISVNLHHLLVRTKNAASKELKYPSGDGEGKEISQDFLTAKNGEVVVVNLNNVLSVFLDKIACCYRAYVENINCERGDVAGIHMLLQCTKRDIEILLVSANCLYMESILCPFMAENKVTSHILSHLGHKPPVRQPSKSDQKYYFQNWFQLWHGVNMCALSILVVCVQMLHKASDCRVSHAPSKATCLDFIMCVLELLEKQCSLDHVIDFRPDIVALCLQKHAASLVKMLLETTTSFFIHFNQEKLESSDVGVIGGMHSKSDVLSGLLNEFVHKKSQSTETDTEPITHHSSALAIIRYIGKELLRFCVILISNSVYLSSNAFSLPLTKKSAISGTNKCKKDASSQKSTAQAFPDSVSYLTEAFVTSLLEIIPQFVYAIVRDQVPVALQKSIGILLPPSPIFQVRRQGGKRNSELLASLKCAFQEMKQQQRKIYHAYSAEVSKSLSNAESLVHMALYSVQTLSTGFIVPSINNTHLLCHATPHTDQREAFRHIWLIGAVDTLTRQMTAVNTYADASSSFGNILEAHLTQLEKSFLVGCVSGSKCNIDMGIPSVLNDLCRGAWGVGTSYFKLLLHSIRIRHGIIREKYGNSTENSEFSTSYLLHGDSEKARKAFERQHQLLREVIRNFLRSGHWESGRELGQLLLQGYQCCLRMLPAHHTPEHCRHLDMNTRAGFYSTSMSRLESSLRGCIPSEVCVSRFGMLSAAEYNRIKYNALGNERICTLSDEIKRTVDTFEDRLKLEGVARCHPIFYTVRFITSPWASEFTNGTSLSSSTSGNESTLEENFRDLAKKCRYEFVSVSRTSDNSGTSSLGICSNEVWLLLKYDSISFASDDDVCGDKSSDDSGYDSMATSTRMSKYLDEIEASHGPLGSYARLRNQLSKSFPDFSFVSNSTLYANQEHTSCCSDGSAKIMQIFEAFPNCHERAGSCGTNDVTILANEECPSVVFAAKVINKMETSQEIMTDDFVKVIQMNESKSQPDFSNSLGVEKDGVSEWQRISNSEHFLIHTYMHSTLKQSRNPHDAKFTITLVISIDAGHRPRNESSTSHVLNPQTAQDYVDLIDHSRIQLWHWSPCSLAKVTSASAVPSLVTHTFFILRNCLARLNHCDELLLYVNSNLSDSSKRPDDVTGCTTILKYVIACVSNIVSPGHRDITNMVMGICDASSVICGEYERRNLLWQNARRVIKKDLLLKKSNFNKWLQKAQTSHTTAPPPRPFDLDFGALEKEFKSSLQAIDNEHMSISLGVDVTQLYNSLASSFTMMGDRLGGKLLSEMERSIEEMSVGEVKLDAARSVPVLVLVESMQREAMTSIEHVFALLRQAVNSLPDDDGVLCTSSKKCVHLHTLPGTADIYIVDEIIGHSVGPEVLSTFQSGSARQGWLQVLRWLELSWFSRIV